MVGGLPGDFHANNLRRVSGSKHIISATVDEDNFKGICKGTGRIQVRLNHGETPDQVKLNFLKLGYSVRDFESDPRKKPVLTGVPQTPTKTMLDHKLEKQA